MKHSDSLKEQVWGQVEQDSLAALLQVITQGYALFSHHFKSDITDEKLVSWLH